MFGKKYVAVDIGNRNIKVVCGKCSDKSIEISEYEIINTPANSIKDGKITNTNLIASVIGDVIKRNSLKSKDLILNITGTGVITRDIQLPSSTDEEIEKILEFEAQQYFPVDLENYVLDYKVLEDTTIDGIPNNNILLCAVPLKQVDEYMKLPGLLKMTIAAIDIPANCISKLVHYMDFYKHTDNNAPEDNTKDYAIIDIGSETASVCIFSGNKLKFNRILLNGSNDIDTAVSTEYNIDFKQAESRKLAVQDINCADTQDDNSIGEVIKSAISNIMGDISRFVEFYNSRGKGNKLGRIYICGGGSKIKGLDRFIEAYFSLPAEYLSAKGRIVYRGKQKWEKFEEDFVFLAGAIGALVRNTGK